MKKLTKAQRSARAKRTATARRKGRAVADFLKKMNPARSLKNVQSVRVKRNKGGSITIIPIKGKVAR